MVATSSPRRQAQLLAARPDLQMQEIRGNLPTRLEKLADTEAMAGTVLAAAGLNRLDFSITADGALEGDAVPDGIRAVALDTELMLPCVGQGAIGIEIRADDGRIAKICERLNHFNTTPPWPPSGRFCVGWAAAAVRLWARRRSVDGTQLRLRAVSFLNDTVQRAEQAGDLREPEALGAAVAAELCG